MANSYEKLDRAVDAIQCLQVTMRVQFCCNYHTCTQLWLSYLSSLKRAESSNDQEGLALLRLAKLYRRLSYYDNVYNSCLWFQLA